MPRFPTRTIVLMMLALASFVWFFVRVHRAARTPFIVTPMSLDAGMR